MTDKTDTQILTRPTARSEGPLSADQVTVLRAQGVPLSYDPVQVGWVPAHCVDDIDMMFKPASGPRYTKLTSAQGASYALRSWREADLDVYHRLLDDAPVWTYMIEDYPAPLTRAHAASLIELSSLSNHHEVNAVLHAGRPIGQVRLLFDYSDDSSTAELSYWLGREHWNAGHGKSMVSMFVKRSFASHRGLRAISARCDPLNTASHRILVAAGFLPNADQTDPKWQWYTMPRPT